MADTKKTVEEVKKGTEKVVAEVKKGAEKAVAEAKPAVEKATKEAKKVAKTAKTKAAKAPAKAKAAAKRVAAAATAAVYVQFNGGEKGVDELVEAAKAEFKAAHKRTRIEEIKLYIVPETSMVYYVVNEDERFKGEFQY